MQNCEICSELVPLDRHHIQSKSCGGSNDKNNITHVCPNCHRKIHLGNIVLEGRFLTTIGYVLFYHLEGDDPVTDKVAECYVFGEQKNP